MLLCPGHMRGRAGRESSYESANKNFYDRIRDRSLTFMNPRKKLTSMLSASLF